MDRQAIYDKVRAHAATMTDRATDANEVRCLYRAPNGMRCFIGGLIPDNLYTEVLERGHSASDIEVYSRIGVIAPTRQELAWLNELQRCHDRAETIEQARKSLDAFGREHGLLPVEE